MEMALPVIGGLGLFLYGMNIMGTGLQKVAGERLKKLIEVLTNNRILGVIVGAIVTMVIQSSSGTTVMVIGFVNAGLMSLPQAAGVIMGANMGTTITAQLIAFKITDYAPLAVAAGVAIWMIASKKKWKNIGEVLIGFGMLFIGMDMMGSGLKPLANSPVFANLIVGLENPVIGMLVGLALTTIVQSSSASIGLLQALAGQGLIGMNLAFPILFGENIGTTTTGLISSLGANKTAKRAAIIHFLFNLIGTLIFMFILKTPIEKLVTYLSPGNIPRQIANAHTFFNIVNVLIQLPFAGLLVKAAIKLVPGDDILEVQEARFLDFRIIETPSIALGQVRKEIRRMGSIAEDNLNRCQKALIEDDLNEIDTVLEQEQKINKLQKEISEYLIQLSNASLSDAQHNAVNIYFNNVGDIERIGDHVENIVELAQEKIAGSFDFTELGEEELNIMFSKCQDAFKYAMEAFESRAEEPARKVLELEDQVDDLEEINRQNHIYRLNKGIIFLDAISNLERISDHSSNLALYILDEYKTDKKINKKL
jgi:phosphate:Na+ symporter